MKGVVCICGKGGVGKTTISALLSRLVLEQKGIRGLAVDADPGGGLSMALSMPVKRTVNDLRKAVIDAVKTHSSDKLNVAASIDFQLLESLSEHSNLAFLAVGRPEEEGCYCQVNSFLRESIQILAGQFDFTVIDAEAGVEQVNRRVIEEIDLLLLVSDQSAKGITVAETIEQVAATTIRGHKTGLLLNRLRSAAEAEYIRRNTALPILGWLPEDETIREFDFSGESFLKLPTESPTLQAAGKIASALLS
ncbi:MAG: AAA family ATPase [Firmicutes bacterium]|nr:AAA family ATPase [Bacillota bacterium]